MMPLKVQAMCVSALCIEHRACVCACVGVAAAAGLTVPKRGPHAGEVEELLHLNRHGAKGDGDEEEHADAPSYLGGCNVAVADKAKGDDSKVQCIMELQRPLALTPVSNLCLVLVAQELQRHANSVSTQKL